MKLKVFEERVWIPDDGVLPRGSRKLIKPGRTKIEWTDYSANPVRFVDAETGAVGWACEKVSDGCKNCYAEGWNARVGNGHRFTPSGRRGLVPFLDEAVLEGMLRFKPQPPFRSPDGRPKVFLGDMTDLFGEWVPFGWLDRIYAVMALRRDVDWQVLTKRPERLAAYLGDGIRNGRGEDWSNYLVRAVTHIPGVSDTQIVDLGRAISGRALPNVWHGTSCEDQAAADARIPHLQRCPSAVRFLSCEPLLGAIDLSCDDPENNRFAWEDHAGWLPPFGETLNRMRCMAEEIAQHEMGSDYMPGVAHVPMPSDAIDWVIVGGESGPGARPCNVAHMRGIVGQCTAAGVPVFVKQLGSVVGMTFEEWNELTSGGADGSDRFDLGAGNSEWGAWRPHNPKGGDPSEWPEDLRVREWPKWVVRESGVVG